MRHDVEIKLTVASEPRMVVATQTFDADEPMVDMITEFLAEFGMADCGEQIITIKITSVP
jgi:hypothetical protein